METTCEASLSWHRQERFRRVCPLLKRAATGELRCSVNTSDVRPFWGRTLLIYGGTIASLYLAATLGYFGLQRFVGVPVSYLTIAYPPHWARLDQARSVYFAERADRALVAGQIGDAEKSLALAYSLDSSNYAAALKLALLYQNAQPVLSDNLYARLLHEHADRRPITATAWYQALLLRGDFATIIPLATTALSVDAAHESAWLNALLFALRRAPQEKLEKLSTSSELPQNPRDLLALERIVRSQPPDLARQALLDARIASPYFDYFRVSRLIELGYATDARALLRNPSQLSVRDRIALSLEASAALGWQSVVDGEIDRLLANPPTPAACEIMAVHLIRNPNAQHLTKALAALEGSPLPANEAAYRASMALLCAAGVHRDADLLKRAAAIVQTLAAGRFRSLPIVESFFLNPLRDARIEPVLPALQPLSAELNYALLDRYGRVRPVSEKNLVPAASPRATR
jgi:hypothetical protein